MCSFFFYSKNSSPEPDENEIAEDVKSEEIELPEKETTPIVETSAAVIAQITQGKEKSLVWKNIKKVCYE